MHTYYTYTHTPPPFKTEKSLTGFAQLFGKVVVYQHPVDHFHPNKRLNLSRKNQTCPTSGTSYCVLFEKTSMKD
jgi:hypothetical protein